MPSVLTGKRLVGLVHNGTPAEKVSVCNLLGAIFRLGNKSGILRVDGLVAVRPLPPRTRVMMEDMFLGLQVGETLVFNLLMQCSSKCVSSHFSLF